MCRISNREISNYRTPLLGIASLMIFVSHFILFPQVKMLALIQSQCIVGVDIFLFLSGFGLVYSIKRNPSWRHFYIQRLKHILPIYIPVATVYCIYLSLTQSEIGGDWLLVLSTLGYWLKTRCFLEWYTPAILLLYAFFPIFYKMIKGIKSIHIVYALTLVYWLIALCVSPDYQPWAFFIFRLPMFIIGMYVAYAKVGIHIWWAFVLFMIGTAFFCLRLTGMDGGDADWLFSVANIALFVIIASVFISRKMERVSKSLIRILSYVGKMSYELFLVQILFLRVHAFRYMNIAAGLFCIIILSVLLHYTLNVSHKKIIILSTQFYENN